MLSTHESHVLLIGLNVDDSLTSFKTLCFLVSKVLRRVSQSGLRCPAALQVASVVASSYYQLGDFCVGNLVFFKPIPFRTA